MNIHEQIDVGSPAELLRSQRCAANLMDEQLDVMAERIFDKAHLRRKTKNPEKIDKAIILGFQAYQYALNNPIVESNDPAGSFVRFVDKAFKHEALLSANSKIAESVAEITLKHFDPVMLNFYAAPYRMADLMQDFLHVMRHSPDPEMKNKAASYIDVRLDACNKENAQLGINAFLVKYPGAKKSKWPVQHLYAKYTMDDYARIWSAAHLLGYDNNLFNNKFEQLVVTLHDVYPRGTEAAVNTIYNEMNGRGHHPFLHSCDASRLEPILAPYLPLNTGTKKQKPSRQPR
jgi:hypothetical protein